MRVVADWVIQPPRCSPVVPPPNSHTCTSSPLSDQGTSVTNTGQQKWWYVTSDCYRRHWGSCRVSISVSCVACSAGTSPRSPPDAAVLASSWAAASGDTGPGPPSRPLPHSWPSESYEIKKHLLFKLLNFGVTCYTGMDNQHLSPIKLFFHSSNLNIYFRLLLLLFVLLTCHPYSSLDWGINKLVEKYHILTFSNPVFGIINPDLEFTLPIRTYLNKLFCDRKPFLDYSTDSFHLCAKPPILYNL